LLLPVICAYRKKKNLGTIRHIPDELWNEVKNILLPAEKLPKTKGHPIVPFRKVLEDGILSMF
jgi:hypothetical protein